LVFACFFCQVGLHSDVFGSGKIGGRQDIGNRSNQESKFDFLSTRQGLVKMDEGHEKIKIVRTNQQSNLRGSCQSIFPLSQHHPSFWKLESPTKNAFNEKR